jgi:alpha-tubulin suppressor-like RCC1 family protein
MGKIRLFTIGLSNKKQLASIFRMGTETGKKRLSLFCGFDCEAFPLLTKTKVAFPSTIGDVGIQDIGAGASVSFAITDEHDVYSWGFGDSCATGFRSDDDIVRPRKLFVLRRYKRDGGPTNCQVHQVVGGGQHTVMLIKRYG